MPGKDQVLSTTTQQTHEKHKYGILRALGEFLKHTTKFQGAGGEMFVGCLPKNKQQSQEWETLSIAKYKDYRIIQDTSAKLLLAVHS